MLRVSEGEAQLLLKGIPLPTQRNPSKKRKQKPKAETRVTSACLELLHAWGVFAWRNNTGAYVRDYARTDGSQGKSFIRYGLKGSADIIGLTKINGRFLAVETKTVNGQLSDDQIEFKQRVKASGGLYILARSVEALEEQRDAIVNA
jgi:hypothetical protein